MSVRRRVVLAAGLVAAAVGVALAVDPGLLSGPALGERAVTLLGGLAVVYAIAPLRRRYMTRREPTDVPEPETRERPPTPGADLDALFDAAGRVDAHSADRRRRLRRRLFDAVVDAVRRREDCDRETAVELVTAGEWTDDPVAASVFADGPVEVPDDEVPRGRRLRFRLSGADRRRFAYRRVADEVTAMTDPGAGP